MATLLARQIRLGRKQRRWTELELAERAGISRATLQKIEKGELGVAIGLVFEVAVLVGVPLFEQESHSLMGHIARTDDKLACCRVRYASAESRWMMISESAYSEAFV